MRSPSELGEKDSELQSTRRELREACQLAKVTKAERDSERAAFQIEKEGLLRDLKQAQIDKIEAEKNAGEFKVKVRKEIQVYKSLNFEQGYKD